MVSYAFFQEFSVRFAKAARGTIFYLGNGESENGAFSEESFFAKHEIPYLKSDLTPSAVILVVHNNTVSRGTLTVNNLTSMNEFFHCTPLLKVYSIIIYTSFLYQQGQDLVDKSR